MFVSLRQITDIMSEDKVVESIKEVAKNVLPENARLLLYGSRARGNYSEGSDWDLLVILDKSKIEQSDYDNIVYPLTDLGWGLGESIIPVLYTKNEWDSMAPMPFYQNVEQDKRILA